LVSNSGKFVDKCKFIVNSTFLVGIGIIYWSNNYIIDTFERIIDPKFYNNDENIRDYSLQKVVYDRSNIIITL